MFECQKPVLPFVFGFPKRKPKEDSLFSEVVQALFGSALLVVVSTGSQRVGLPFVSPYTSTGSSITGLGCLRGLGESHQTLRAKRRKLAAVLTTLAPYFDEGRMHLAHQLSVSTTSYNGPRTFSRIFVSQSE